MNMSRQRIWRAQFGKKSSVWKLGVEPADESPAYSMALVMDPSLKYAWFEQRWDEPPKCAWISGVKSMAYSR
jgi:hypothetical protein